MKKLLGALVILIVPQFLIGCMTVADMSTMESEHPAWTPDVRQKILNHQTWPGMTPEQFECYLGQMAEAYIGYNPGLIGYAMGDTHLHYSADSINYFEGGWEVRHYTIMSYSNSPGGYFAVARFRNGGYVDSDGHKIR